MDRAISTFTIGIRELFRIFVPGLLFLTFLRFEFPCLFVHENYELPIGYFIIVSFFIGLAWYTVQFHRYIPPWKNVFRKQIGRLEKEVKVALGNMKPSIGNYYEPEYKYFLELKTDRSFVERVHYFTSFYYLLAGISQLLVIMSFIEIGLIYAYGLIHILYALISLILACVIFRFSSYQLEKIINEQIIVVRTNKKEFESIQKLECEDLCSVLADKCNTLLREIVLDPDKRDYQIKCNKQYAKDWKTGLETITYIIKINTSYPLSISGEPGGYKGFYKERIESILNHTASIYQTEKLLSRAAIEIIPTRPHKDSLESLVPLSKAYNSIITDDSPVLEVMKKYSINDVLVRGRHIVGPNPALVQVVEKTCEEKTVKTALDLFSGTGIIAVVLSKYNTPNITCVDNGSHFKTAKRHLYNTLHNIRCITKDAFVYGIRDKYDLIVADPYYEDAFNFLIKRIGDIYDSTVRFIFVCCGEENEYLRNQCKGILQPYFKQNIKEVTYFGQSIFICDK